ncbi:MAG: hypothetical protein KJP07_17725 [Desulfatitalea sp.]|nr:hypothetical protein [Desulfatitalea sp.]
MKRLHLFEIEDQRWCPELIRNGITDLLRLIECALGSYRLIIPRLISILTKLRTEEIVDLCSGGGGIWINLCHELDKVGNKTKIHLTDLNPNRASLGSLPVISSGRINIIANPVDATNVPSPLKGFRTFFTSFHHFPPDAARAVLCDVVKRKEGIGIFDEPEEYSKYSIDVSRSLFCFPSSFRQPKPYAPIGSIHGDTG